MNRHSLLKPDLDARDFGSDFDPVLTGVADGLARLFPPVRHLRPTETDDEAAHRDEADEEAGAD